MARLQDILAKVQIKDENGEWRDLKEFDTDYSRKEETNSTNRWTTNILVKEGPFRLLISVTEDFDWKNFNALLLKLTCQQGFWIKEYPVLALKTASTIQDEYGTLGCMAENLETKQLEYSLESVYLPLIPPATDAGFAMTTFSFEKVEGSFTSSNGAMREKRSIDMHNIRLAVQRCRILELSFKETRLKTIHNLKQRDLSRAVLFPEVDIETQGKVDVYNMLKKSRRSGERLGGPGYSAEKDVPPVIFNFVYHSKTPKDTINPDDIDIVDTTASLRPRMSVSDRPLRQESNISTSAPYSWTAPFSNDRFYDSAKLEDEKDMRSLAGPQPMRDEEEHTSSYEDEYDDYDFKRVSTPLWNPPDRTAPLRAIPASAPTSAPASSRVPDACSTLATTPKASLASGATSAPTVASFSTATLVTNISTFLTYTPASSSAVNSVVQVLKDIERNFENIEATRHEVLIRCRSKQQSVRSEIDGNEEAIGTDQAKIEDYEAQILRLNDTIGALNLDVEEKKSKNISLSEKHDTLQDEIKALEAQGVTNQNKLDALLKRTNDSLTELNTELDEQVRQSSSSIKRRRSQTSLDNSPCNEGGRMRRTSSVMMDIDSD